MSEQPDLPKRPADYIEAVLFDFQKAKQAADDAMAAMVQHAEMWRGENDGRAHWIAEMMRILNIENKDGFHCIDAHEHVRKLVFELAELRHTRIASGTFGVMGELQKKVDSIGKMLDLRSELLDNARKKEDYLFAEISRLQKLVATRDGQLGEITSVARATLDCNGHGPDLRKLAKVTEKLINLGFGCVPGTPEDPETPASPSLLP